MAQTSAQHHPQGRDALLLKAPKHEGGPDPYIKVLNEADISASCLTVLSFNFIHQEELYSRLCSPEKYSGIIFTSQRAVEAVSKATTAQLDWSSCHGDKWKSKRAYVVGKATAAAAKAASFTPHGEESGNAEALVKIMIEEVATSDCPLLFPCGNLRKETIPKTLTAQGIKFDAVTAYETTTDPELGSKLMQNISDKGMPRFVVFFSPSGVDGTAKHLSAMCGSTAAADDIKVKYIAIGPSTEEALKLHGLPMAAMAPKPTPEGLLQAIQSTFS